MEKLFTNGFRISPSQLYTHIRRNLLYSPFHMSVDVRGNVRALVSSNMTNKLHKETLLVSVLVQCGAWSRSLTTPGALTNIPVREPSHAACNNITEPHHHRHPFPSLGPLSPSSPHSIDLRLLSKASADVQNPGRIPPRMHPTLQQLRVPATHHVSLRRRQYLQTLSQSPIRQTLR